MVTHVTATIMPCRNYWVEMEFLTQSAQWRVVEALTGEAVNGAIQFCICSADFRNEFTYRLCVYLPSSFDVLAVSSPFSFPKYHGEVKTLCIRLVPH